MIKLDNTDTIKQISIELHDSQIAERIAVEAAKQIEGKILENFEWIKEKLLEKLQYDLMYQLLKVEKGYDGPARLTAFQEALIAAIVTKLDDVELRNTLIKALLTR